MPIILSPSCSRGASSRGVLMMSSLQAERPAGTWGGDSPHVDAAFCGRRFAPVAPGPHRWTIHGHYDPRSAGGTSPSRRWSAARRACLRSQGDALHSTARCEWIDQDVAPHGAPSPLIYAEGQRNTGAPGAGQTIRAMTHACMSSRRNSWLFDNRIGMQRTS